MSLCFLACSKEVNNKNTNLTPTTGVPSVAIPVTGAYLNLNFANHATINEDDDQISFFRIDSSANLKIPQYVSSMTFANAVSKPNLNLYLNQSLVCVYIWVSNKYQAHTSCYSSLSVAAHDVMYLDHIPRSQTVTLDMLVE